MTYPTRFDIEIAVLNLDKFNRDAILTKGQPMKIHGKIVKYSGGYTLVFPIDLPNKRYALRCWIQDIGNGKSRYKAIDDYLKKIKLPYFSDFSYVEKGLLVKGKEWDTVRMEWVNGLKLKDYLEDNLTSPDKLRQFAKHFLEMVESLHKFEVAHGDLQHGNILVKPNNTIALVDYDSLYVPKLRGELDLVKGLRGYQHPARFKNNENTSSKIDYFSELVIYLSIIALAENASLWEKYNFEHSEDLLFTQKDFLNPNKSRVFQQLKGMTPEIILLSKSLQKNCEMQDINSILPLEEVVENIDRRMNLLNDESLKEPIADGTLSVIEQIRESSKRKIIPKESKEAAKEIIKKMNNKP